jgi:hypothetical protein
MWRISMLSLLIVTGLAAGCGPAVEPSLAPTSQPATPASSLSIPPHRTESPAPTPSTEDQPAVDDDLSATASAPAEDQPRVDDGPAVPASPAARARIDLARRLQVNSAQISVVNVTTRRVDEAVISCLSKGAGSENLWNELEEVQWVTLAIGGKRYHYVALQDLTIYCGK